MTENGCVLATWLVYVILVFWHPDYDIVFYSVKIENVGEKKGAASGYVLKSPLIVRLAVQFSQIQNRGEQQIHISSWSQKITVVSLEKLLMIFSHMLLIIFSAN